MNGISTYSLDLSLVTVTEECSRFFLIRESILNISMHPATGNETTWSTSLLLLILLLPCGSSLAGAPDETRSMPDPRIQEAIARLVKNRTTVAIAHRFRRQ